MATGNGENGDERPDVRAAGPTVPRVPQTTRTLHDRAEPVFHLPVAVLVAIGACVAIHLLRTQILNTDQDVAMILRTAFIPAFLSGPYAIDVWTFTSPVTYSLLHGSFVHLGVNMIWLAAFGSPLASRLGAWRFALFWAVSAAAGAGVFFLFNPMLEAPLVGASGSIAAMMGAAARFAFRIDRRGPGSRFSGQPLSVARALRSRNVAVFVGIWMLINFATGLIGGGGPDMSASVAWEAHLGGFLVGFLLLDLFLPREAPVRS